jgi:hypothetical protein
MSPCGAVHRVEWWGGADNATETRRHKAPTPPQSLSLSLSLGLAVFACAALSATPSGAHDIHLVPQHHSSSFDVACSDVQRDLNAAIARGDTVFHLPQGDIRCAVDFVVSE